MADQTFKEVRQGSLPLLRSLVARLALLRASRYLPYQHRERTRAECRVVDRMTAERAAHFEAPLVTPPASPARLEIAWKVCSFPVVSNPTLSAFPSVCS
jgi:hypothetical protein